MSDEMEEWLEELRENGRSGFYGLSAENVARVLEMADGFEQREANLRGQLRVARDALDYIGQCGTHGQHLCAACASSIADGTINDNEPTARALIHDRAAATKALEQIADPGDYVPAEQLRAEEAKTRGEWMVLNDIVQMGGLAGERAAEIMKALGLKAPFVPLHEREAAVRASGDSDLLAELLRRGYNIDAPMRAQFTER